MGFTTVLCSWLLALALIQPFLPVAGVPYPDGYGYGCRNPIIRKEWRTLTSSEKLGYISAVKCLQRLPAKSTASTPGAVNRFDDFTGVHIRNGNTIHFVGHFYPWHRYFVALYEQALINECYYTGAQPYWDWTQDSGSEDDFLASPIFDPVFGFGGNGPWIANSTDPLIVVPGRTGGGCVKDGPFKSLELHLGPRESIVRYNHCLTRDFSPLVATELCTSALVEDAQNQSTFGWFDLKSQGGGISLSELKYHAGGHLSVGGELGIQGDIWASPGDPLFYLHHAYMDRLWWDWQNKDPSVRLTEISGPIYQFDFPFGRATSRGNVTLDFKLIVNELGLDVPLSEVMNIKGGVLCYDYQ